MQTYQNKEDLERLIDVYEIEPDRVHFSAQGGGFGLIMSPETLARDWQLAPEPTFHRAIASAEFLLAGDGQYARFPCYSDGRHWNGWGMPYFERDVVQKVMDLINTARAEAGQGHQLIWTGVDVIDVGDDNGEEIIVYEPTTIDTLTGPVQVWGLGAGYWCWEATEKMVRVNLSTHCPDQLTETLALRNIRIVDNTNAPWDVVYEGAEADLRAMHAEHWGEYSEPFPHEEKA